MLTIHAIEETGYNVTIHGYQTRYQPRNVEKIGAHDAQIFFGEACGEQKSPELSPDPESGRAVR